MIAIDINRLIQHDRRHQIGNWAVAVCQRLAQLRLPVGLGGFVQSQNGQSTLVVIEKNGFKVVEIQDQKKRFIALDWHRHQISINGRTALKEELIVLLNAIKNCFLGAKTGKLIAFNANGFTVEAILSLIENQELLPPWESSVVPGAVLASIGKQLQPQADAPDRIGAFVEKTKALFLSLKNGFPKLIIHNSNERPKPDLTYRLTVEESVGLYSETSHFVKNAINVTFEPPGININGQPITETGCTWFSDKLAKISQDLAGNRADIFESKC